MRSNGTGAQLSTSVVRTRGRFVKAFVWQMKVSSSSFSLSAVDRDTIPKPFQDSQTAKIRERLTVEVKEALKVSLDGCIRCLS